MTQQTECLLQLNEMLSELYSSNDTAGTEDYLPNRDPEIIHVAVLECEQMPENIVQSHGNFTDIFNQWLQSGVRRLNSKRGLRYGTMIEVSRWPVLNGIYPSDLTVVDAFVVTGSMSSAYDAYPWIKTLERYIRVVYNTRPHIKFFGSCFGHQIIAQALLGKHGVRVESCDYGWENGVHDIVHSRQFISYFPFLRGEVMRYQFVHSDHVITDSLPHGWMSIGYSDLCRIQGLFKPGRVLTFQGHPEFDQQILYYFMDTLGSGGIIDNDTYELSLKLVNQESTSQLAAELVVRFLDE